MTYAGESLAINVATANDTDDTLADDITLRAGSRTLAAGDEWVMWVPPFATPPDGTVVSWAVVVDSGSVTVTAEEALDPTYDYDPDYPADTALGSHTLTMGTELIPSAITAGTIASTGDLLMLRLVATSGSAVVSQVKVRLWPPGGPVGGWALAPAGYVVTGTGSARYVSGPTSTTPGFVDAGDPGAAFDAAGASLAALVSADSGRLLDSGRTPRTNVEASIVLSTQVLHEPDGYHGTGFAGMAGCLVSWPSDILESNLADATPGDFGTDWATPPDEVPSDTTVFEPLGTVSGTWGDLSATVTESTTGVDQPSDGSHYVSIVSVPDALPTDGSVVFHFPLTGSSSPIGAATLPVPVTSPGFLVSLAHDLMTTPEAYEGPGSFGILTDGWQAGADFTLVGTRPTYTVLLPAFRYWSMTGSPPPLRQRNRGRVRSRLHADRQTSIRSRGFL